MKKPKSPRRLFKPSDNGNVVLNFTGSPVGELGLLARSYHEAGKRLVEPFNDSAAYSDFDACPVVFVYRHALELAIKAVLLLGNDLAMALDNSDLITEKVLDGHGLAHHLTKIKAIFEAVDWADAFKDAGLVDAEAFIKEFDAVDPRSMAFRYTVKKDGTASVDAHFAFAPKEFAAALDPVLDSLLGACCGLEEYLQSANEYNAEMRSGSDDYHYDDDSDVYGDYVYDVHYDS